MRNKVKKKRPTKKTKLNINLHSVHHSATRYPKLLSWLSILACHAQRSKQKSGEHQAFGIDDLTSADDLRPEENRSESVEMRRVGLRRPVWQHCPLGPANPIVSRWKIARFVAARRRGLVRLLHASHTYPATFT